MNECDKLRYSYSSYIDGELAPESRRSIENHLTQCPECKETVLRLRAVQEVLHHLPQISTSSEFEQQLHLRIQRHARHRYLNLPFRQIDWKLPAIAAVMVVLLVAVVFMFDTPSTQSGFTNQQQSSMAPGLSGESTSDNAFTPSEQQIQRKAAQPVAPVATGESDTLSKPTDKRFQENIQLVNDKASQ